MRIGYTFCNRQIELQALTHRSAGGHNNERLEFLGDALLNAIVAEAIYSRFPTATEGEMTRLRARLVREETLADIARGLEVGEALVLGPGEMKSGSRRRASILSDALEALVAAIYLDGGIEVCRQNVLAWFEGRLQQLIPAAEHRDNKTRLQEWLQARHRALPQYVVVDESGADNARQFRVQCVVDGLSESCVAEGSSKKLAEQGAAGMALEKLLVPESGSIS